MKFAIINFAAASFIALLLPPCAHAQGFWRHPEIAGKNSLFADAGLAPLVFGADEFEFPILPLELRVDYMLPLPLPLSVGAFFKTPNPNLKSFGARAAFHFDPGSPRLDLYLAYVFDFGFVRNGLLEEYGDEKADMRFYDFRAGARWFFDPVFGIAAETDFKVMGLIFLVTIKIF